jgi:hypothetical protein
LALYCCLINFIAIPSLKVNLTLASLPIILCEYGREHKDNQEDKNTEFVATKIKKLVNNDAVAIKVTLKIIIFKLEISQTS